MVGLGATRVVIRCNEVNSREGSETNDEEADQKVTHRLQ